MTVPTYHIRSFYRWSTLAKFSVIGATGAGLYLWIPAMQRATGLPRLAVPILLGITLVVLSSSIGLIRRLGADHPVSRDIDRVCTVGLHCGAAIIIPAVSKNYVAGFWFVSALFYALVRFLYAPRGKLIALMILIPVFSYALHLLIHHLPTGDPICYAELATCVIATVFFWYSGSRPRMHPRNPHSLTPFLSPRVNVRSLNSFWTDIRPARLPRSYSSHREPPSCTSRASMTSPASTRVSASWPPTAGTLSHGQADLPGERRSVM